MDRNRIFDEFQRLGNGNLAPGMGLGLSIVRRACNKLGHPIRLESEAMRGTVFRVGLPLVDAVSQPPRSDPPDAALRALRGRVALVVENDADMRRGYEMILRDRLGMAARLSASTDEALATMGEEPPDIILADYSLENGDTGLKAIRALREQAGQHVPAVMVTAHSDPAVNRGCAALGVPVLAKPVRPAELAEILSRLLG